jgi:hypothetical protein
MNYIYNKQTQDTINGDQEVNQKDLNPQDTALGKAKEGKLISNDLYFS